MATAHPLCWRKQQKTQRLPPQSPPPMALLVAWLAVCWSAGEAHAFDDVAGVIPQPDACAELMVQQFPNIAPHQRIDQYNYFAWPVPKVVHQIADDGPGGAALGNSSPWADYAGRMGYQWVRWSVSDIDRADFDGLPTVRHAVHALLQAGREDAASQLFALAILAVRGGIFASATTLPPQLRGGPVDLAQVVNLRGLSVATSLRARDVGHMSIYVSHSLMAAPKAHPWLLHIAPLAAKNALDLMAAGHASLPARYLSGNAFLSKNLFGTFNVLLYTYLQSLGMYPAETEPGSPDALD